MIDDAEFGPLDVGVDVVGDRSCAANSASIVAGDICGLALKPVVTWVDFTEAGAGLETLNGSAEPWLLALDCASDFADEVSVLRTSSAVDATPRANSMIESRDAATGGSYSHPIFQQTACHGEILDHDPIRRNRIMIISLFEHDLFGKPVSTFPDHALVNTQLFRIQAFAIPAIDAADGRIFRP